MSRDIGVFGRSILVKKKVLKIGEKKDKQIVREYYEVEFSRKVNEQPLVNTSSFVVFFAVR